MLTVIIGVVFIALGFLGRVFPNLIAGYSTMTAEQKAKVDINGLSSFMRNGFIAMGALTIAGYYFFMMLNLEVVAEMMVLVSAFLALPYILIGARRFDGNRAQGDAKSSGTRIIYTLIAVAVAGLLFYGLKPSDIEVNETSLRITGMYSEEVLLTDIETVELLEAAPSLLVRTNGFSLGSINKGYYKVDGLGKCKVILQSANGPCMLIKTKSGKCILFGYKDANKTRVNYTTLRVYLGDDDY